MTNAAAWSSPYLTEYAATCTDRTSVVACADVAEVTLFGSCAQHQMKKQRPWMALYTAAWGGVAGCLFFMITLWSKQIAHGRLNEGYGTRRPLSA